MSIYFVSISWLFRFIALGFAAGVWAAYGAGGMELGHWFATATIIFMVGYFTLQFMQIFIFYKNIIIYLNYNSIVKTTIENIKSISLQGRNISETKVILWPIESAHIITTVEDKVSTLLIELLRENRKRKISLRQFSPKNRVKIINALIEKVKNV